MNKQPIIHIVIRYHRQSNSWLLLEGGIHVQTIGDVPENQGGAQRLSGLATHVLNLVRSLGSDRGRAEVYGYDIIGQPDTHIGSIVVSNGQAEIQQAKAGLTTTG